MFHRATTLLLISLSSCGCSAGGSGPVWNSSSEPVGSFPESATSTPEVPVTHLLPELEDGYRVARSQASFLPNAPVGPPEELRGVWIPPGSPRDWDALMAQLKRHGFNAVFVRVARGGNAIYPSRLLPQDQWAAEADGDELAQAIAAARRHALQFHAWKVCFHMASARRPSTGRAANDFYREMAQQDRLVRDSKGKQSYWLNPSDPRNQELEVQAARELVQNYPVDGYHLDYIRYPDAAPGFDYHFGSVSRREFDRWLGRPVVDWPREVISGWLKMRYEQWERDNITRLVQRISGAVKSARPEVLVSAAVWRNIRLHRATVKQDWPLWARQGWLDFVVPMNYTKDLADFRTLVRRQLSYTRGRAPLVAGIGSWQLPSPDAVLEQVQAARAVGADGFVLFSGNARDFNKQIAALSAGSTRIPVVPGIGGPQFEFLWPPEILAARYHPLAVEAGRPTSLTIRLPERAWPSRSRQTALPVSVTVEDLQGRPVASARRMNFRPGDSHRIPIFPQRAAIRPVVRGTVQRGGTWIRFVDRGPVCQPHSAAEIAELRARRLPPRAKKPGLRVGVYADGQGADGTLAALGHFRGIAPVRVYHLEAAHLEALDLLVLTPLRDLSDMTEQTGQTIQDWVKRGGRLILARNAVGFRWHPRLFPQVGEGERIVTEPAIRVVTALSGLVSGTQLSHGYAGHVRLKVSPAAQVLLAEHRTGQPVVAAGRVGDGTVILNGLFPGSADEAELDSSSLRVLKALLVYR